MKTSACMHVHKYTARQNTQKMPCTRTSNSIFVHAQTRVFGSLRLALHLKQIYLSTHTHIYTIACAADKQVCRLTPAAIIVFAMQHSSPQNHTNIRLAKNGHSQRRARSGQGGQHAKQLRQQIGTQIKRLCHAPGRGR